MDETGQWCTECLGPVSVAVNAQHGVRLCAQCAEQFYCSCTGCGELIPQDEAVRRDGTLYCMACLAAPATGEDTAALSGTDLEALVAEFIRLHAEAKQLNDRLEAVKEQLKRHAASQQRVANAVLLRTGEYTVKCGYSVRVSYNAEKLAAVETLLGTEHFAALFARKITFSAIKQPLDAFLADETVDTAAARTAILAAAERTEVTTITPVTSKRQAGTSDPSPVPRADRP